jgi:hypothetical protein
MSNQCFHDLKVKNLKVKTLKACDISTKTLTADDIISKTLIVNGVNISGVVSNFANSGPKNYEPLFDCTTFNPDYPHFENNSPVKPSFPVSDALWTALLNNLSIEQKRLTDNFIAGRHTLGLPQSEKPDPTGIYVELVATKTLPLIIEDLTKHTAEYESSIGWDLHCVNTFYNEFINPDTVTFTGQVINGVLEVTSIDSGVLEYGQVLRGASIPWGTTIFEQLSGAPGSIGTYSLYPGDIFDTELETMQSSKWGPKTVSIFIQAGTIPQGQTEADIRKIDNGNRQFEPTIDYSGDDGSGLTHTGEQWIGQKPIANKIINELFVLNDKVIPVIQLAIFAERGVSIYFPKPICAPTPLIKTRQTNNIVNGGGITITTNGRLLSSVSINRAYTNGSVYTYVIDVAFNFTGNINISGVSEPGYNLSNIPPNPENSSNLTPNTYDFGPGYIIVYREDSLPNGTGGMVSDAV